MPDENTAGETAVEEAPEPQEASPGASAADAPDPEQATTPAEQPETGRRKRPVLAVVLTVLAFLLVFAALVVPNRLDEIRPTTFLRIPVEAIVGVALLLVLPGRARTIVAAVLGVLLGLLTVIKFFDTGFGSELSRAFNPVQDFGLLDDAFGVVRDSLGTGLATTVAVLAVLLAVGVPVLLTLAVLRLTRTAVRHRRLAMGTTAVLAGAWAVLALVGAQFSEGIPVASYSEGRLAVDRTRLTYDSVTDADRFNGLIALDSFKNTPGDKLLTALRGKDVLVTFIESYGRSAVEDPIISPGVNKVLDEQTRVLKDKGYDSRSAFLTSSTFGGGSWLGHSTFQSGLFVNSEQRYDRFVKTDRLTVASAFKRAGWHTVGVEPGNTRAWPEGDIYQYDTQYNVKSIGYHGWAFSWSTMPDQFVFQQFQNLEYGKPGRSPLMAEITLTSSHTPWAPQPRFLPWDQVGDGSIYNPMTKEGPSPEQVWKSATGVKRAYGRSIEYSLTSITSWIENYADPNLVMIVLGDHQPAEIVAGKNASRDVPTTIIAKDPKVLEAIDGWGWQQGMHPSPSAPSWRMDTFRDRFFTAYGSTPSG